MAAATAVLALVAAGCSDDKDDSASPEATTGGTTAEGGSTETTVAGGATTTVPSPMGDIVATALTNQVFTQLAGMAVDADLVQALRGGPFTVFAPTDTAFNKLPLDVLHAVQDADGGALAKTVLLHHVIDGPISPAELAEGELTTLAGTTLAVTKVGEQFFVDGNPIGPGVEATNGWVYVMNDVLVPAIGDIVTIAQTLPGFETLVSLVVEAELVETLQGAGPFTVFAPVDAAFEALPTSTLNQVANNRDLLTTVLTHHVVSGKITADQFVEGAQFTTLAGTTLTVTITEQTVTVYGVESVQKVININGVPIAVQNVQASNGVIHAMGGVLIPED